jgi:hypothetical protein
MCYDDFGSFVWFFRACAHLKVESVDGGKLLNEELKKCSHGPIEMQPRLFPGGTGREKKKESIKRAASAPTEI